MKSYKSYYVAFGVSVCVGVISLFYLVHKRRKENEADYANFSEKSNERIVEGQEMEFPVKEESSPVNEEESFITEEIHAVQVKHDFSKPPSNAFVVQNGVAEAKSDNKSFSGTTITPVTENPISQIDALEVTVVNADRNGNDYQNACDSSLFESKAQGDGRASDKGLNSEDATVENHEVKETKSKPSRRGDSDEDKALGSSSEISPLQVAQTLMRLSKPGALASLEYFDAVVLNYTVSFVQGKERARILETIAGAASFSVNLPLLTSSGCMKSLQDMLRQAALDRRSCSEAEKIALLHALTNISCSDVNQQILKTSVDDLFSLSEGQEESRVGLACLCVIANLSLANHCHPEVAEYGTRLFELLEDDDTALLKQVLTILLNLCCEASTVPLLLTAKAPSEMATFVAKTGTIGKNIDLLIKWLRILRNLYKIIREQDITAEKLSAIGQGDLSGSVYEELQNLRLHMKACVFLLCHNKESHGLAASAKMLYEYLETTN